VVLHLGDFSLATLEQDQFISEVLYGEIFLLRGNHDKKNPKYYSELGIELIKEKKIIYKNLIFSHRPEKVLEGEFNLHGHIHHLNPENSFHINVCVEKLNFKPVRLSEILRERGLWEEGN
jgi:calcineurin-like phosphoesterase family protein